MEGDSRMIRNSCLFCSVPCSEISLHLQDGIGMVGGGGRDQLQGTLQSQEFILTQLLDIPEEWWAQKMKGFGGDQDNSWFQTCERCNKTVERGWSIHRRILRLQGQFNLIKRQIKKVMQEKKDREDFEDGLDGEIWNLVFPDWTPNYAMNEDVGIKTEPEPDDSWEIDVNNLEYVSGNAQENINEFILPSVIQGGEEEINGIMSNQIKRKRGRPRKTWRIELDPLRTDTVKRGRGRPRKYMIIYNHPENVSDTTPNYSLESDVVVKTEPGLDEGQRFYVEESIDDVDYFSELEPELHDKDDYDYIPTNSVKQNNSGMKRPRGRPRKFRDYELDGLKVGVGNVKRKRGRPRKIRDNSENGMPNLESADVSPSNSKVTGEPKSS